MSDIMKILVLLLLVPVVMVIGWLMFNRVVTYFWPEMDLLTKVCLMTLTCGGVSLGGKNK